jgi:hypothetical protein
MEMPCELSVSMGDPLATKPLRSAQAVIESLMLLAQFWCLSHSWLTKVALNTDQEIGIVQIASFITLLQGVTASSATLKTPMLQVDPQLLLHFHPTSTLVTGFVLILLAVFIIMRLGNSASNAIPNDQVVQIHLPTTIAKIRMEGMAVVVLQEEDGHLPTSDREIGSAQIRHARFRILHRELAAFAVILLVPILHSTAIMAHLEVCPVVPV